MRGFERLAKRYFVLRTIAIYAVVGALWIYLSDSAVAWLIPDSSAIVKFSMYKGILFIALTSALLFVLMSRYAGALVKAQVKQREHQRLLVAVLDYSPNVIFLKDNEGRYVLANKMVEELLGQDIRGKTDFDIFPRETAERHRSDDLKVAKTLKPVVLEESIPVGNEVREFLSTKFPILDDQGAVFGICGIAIEMTEKNKADREREQLRAQIAVSARLASIGMLSAGVAHEINNPLTTIKGNCDLLAESLQARGADAEELNFLQRVSQASDRIQAIVKGLRNYARIETDETRVPVNLHAVINDTVAMCAPLYRHDGIEVDVRLKASRAVFRGGAGKMQQVLLNLLSNAHDSFTQNGPGIIVIETNDGDGEVVLTVQDEGCGISPENIPKIFNPFFTTKDPGKGTGLGLSLVQTMIVSFGGRIDVRSVPGKGTTFFVYLPLLAESQVPERPAPAARRQPKDEPRATYSGHVLVVDDEADIRTLLSHYLKRLGLSTTEACDGRDALEKLGQQAFDLVITDIKMPRMTGLAFLEEAHKIAPPATRFAVVTGGFIQDYSDEERKIIHERAHGVLTKPFDQNSVAALLEEMKAGVE